MSKSLPDKQAVLDAIRRAAQMLGHPPSRAEFKAKSGMTEYQVLRYFPSWREAVRAAGLDPNLTNIRLEEGLLLKEWGELVRKLRQIPTISQYRREGKHSPSVFASRFGPWSGIPDKFREFAQDKLEWADVLMLLPLAPTKLKATGTPPTPIGGLKEASTSPALPRQRHRKLEARPVYGDPIDFRGLRHEPVNEQGVVFLFGMVAKELGYMVEAVQAGFPDCDAKRQVGPNKWQRVRIEFEFESREFREHGHPEDGCDVIVCWRHNRPDCPAHLEIVELESVIKSLARSED